MFRGVSDYASREGLLSSASLNYLATMNALSVVVEFIGLFGKEAAIHDHWKWTPFEAREISLNM